LSMFLFFVKPQFAGGKLIGFGRRDEAGREGTLQHAARHATPAAPLALTANRSSECKLLPKGISGGGVGKAKADMELFGLVSTPAAADWDASCTVECINL
jgi:hypothetical protein